MTSKNPRVSIFLPVYNTKKYVSEAVESALNQTHENIEIVISDDASTDGTQDLLSDYHSKYPDKINLFIQEQNLGVTANCNFILENCTGEYICFFAGDDILNPNCVSANLKHMRSNQKIVAAFHRTTRIDSDSKLIEENRLHLDTHIGDLDKLIKKGVYFGINGMVIKKSALEGNNFDTSMSLASDISIVWTALSGQGARYVYIDEELSYWRYHTASVTNTNYINCTKDAILQEYLLTKRFPDYWRYSLSRVRSQMKSFYQGGYTTFTKIKLGLFLFSDTIHSSRSFLHSLGVDLEGHQLKFLKNL